MSDLIHPDPNYPRLTSVEVVGDYSVRVTFSDGAVRDADLARSFVRRRGEPIGDPGFFARVALDEDTDTLVWPEEFFHVHGEELYEDFYPPVAASH